MTVVIDSSSDAYLDWFFSKAKDYPLLTPVQEKEADGKKWLAVSQTLDLLLTDPAGRGLLEQFVSHCSAGAPDIAHFSNREAFFVVRRELEPYLPDGKLAAKLAKFGRALAGDTALTHDNKAVSALSLPASLVMGLAQLILRRSGKSSRSSVADALVAWRARFGLTEIEGACLHKTQASALAKIAAQYLSARETLTLHNLRLVYTIAGRFRDSRLPVTDLVQEGTLGLIRAAEKYDHRTGYRFSTYAFNWISQAVRRYVSERGSMIRYPGQVQGHVNRIHRERLRALEATGSEPSIEELAESTRLSTERVREMMSLTNLTQSLDEPLGAETDQTLADVVPDEISPTVDRGSETQSLRRYLLEQVDLLEHDERQVLLGRWGIMQDRPLTRAELADSLCISREWVRQLELSAIDKLRESGDLAQVYRDHYETGPA